MSSSAKPTLRLDWCSHAAAKYAVTKWYYRDDMPVGKMVRVGVWEDDVFSGVLLFGSGASDSLGKRWGLTPLETAELTRVALAPTHATPVSRLLRVALLLLRQRCPGLRLVVTFADPTEGHHGGVYQANGWIFLGMTAADKRYLYRGRWYHSRGVRECGYVTRLGTRTRCPRPSECERVEKTEPKLRYGYALDDEIAERLRADAKPYPKRRSSDAISTS